MARARQRQRARTWCWGWALARRSFARSFGGTVLVAAALPLAGRRSARRGSLCLPLSWTPSARSSSRWTASSSPSSPPGRASAGGQGSLRHGRRPDDLRLGRLRRARAVDERRRRCVLLEAAGYATSARRTCTSSPTGSRRRTSTTAPCRTRPRPGGRRAARAAARRRRSSLGLADARARHRHRRLDPHPRRVLRDRRASSRRFGLVPIDGVFPLAPSFDHAGPMARDVGRLRRADARRSRPGSRSSRSRSARCAVGVAWARPRRAARAARALEAAAASSARSRPVELPGRRRRSRPRSCARSATSTASSTPSTASCTARTSAPKIERCLAVDDAEAAAARARRASSYARSATRRSTASTCCSRRRSRSSRRRADVDELDGARDVRALHVPVQRARLARARAAVRPGRGRAARIGAARRPARRRTGSCSPPGSRSRRRSSC